MIGVLVARHLDEANMWKWATSRFKIEILGLKILVIIRMLKEERVLSKEMIGERYINKLSYKRSQMRLLTWPSSF